jgi:hypothetical protein
MKIIFVIDDEAHAELHGEFSTFQEAVAELERRAEIPWNEPPNIAPCTNWRDCGRRYEIVEYEITELPWKEISRTPMLEVSASGLQWRSNVRPAH